MSVTKTLSKLVRKVLSEKHIYLGKCKSQINQFDYNNIIREIHKRNSVKGEYTNT